MKSLHTMAWVALATAMAVAAAAWGQVPGTGGRPGGGGTGTGAGGTGTSIRDKMGGMPQTRGDDARTAGANFVELVNIRLSQLEEDLNLLPAQLPLWTTYRKNVLQMLDDERRGLRISAAETTAPKRLDGLADSARNRLTAVEDIVDSGKALYAALTPEQKAVADRRLALPLTTLMGNDNGSDLRTRTPLRAGGADAPPPPPPPPR
jgi:hypothetical protein